jgi:hypothetical protein
MLIATIIDCGTCQSLIANYLILCWNGRIACLQIWTQIFAHHLMEAFKMIYPQY